MKARTSLILILFTFFASAAWPQAQPQGKHKIITYEVPGAGNGAGQGSQAFGINSSGDLGILHRREQRVSRLPANAVKRIATNTMPPEVRAGCPLIAHFAMSGFPQQLAEIITRGQPGATSRSSRPGMKSRRGA